MKGCFTTLLLALIVAFIAAFFGRSCHRGDVEKILNDRVVAEVESAYPGVQVRYDHLTAVVTGSATDEEVEEIRNKIRELSLGNGRIHFALDGTAPPVPRRLPSHFTVVRDGDQLLLTGVVDSDQTRTLLEAKAAEVKGVEVTNQLEVGENIAPFPAFGTATSAIPALMSRSRDGRIEASPDKVLVSGKVRSDEIKETLLAEVFNSTEWEGAEVVERILVVPLPRTIPSSFRFARVSDKVTLTGTVDREETVGQIVAGFEGAGYTVDNQLKTGERVMAYPGLDAIAAVPGLLKQVKSGDFEFAPERLVFSGEVESPAIKERVLSAFSGDTWAGFEKVDKLVVKWPRTLPSRFRFARSGGKVTLTGEVDSAETRDAVGAAVANTGLTVDNQLKVNERVIKFPRLDSLLAGLPGFLDGFPGGCFDFSPERVVLNGEMDAEDKKKGMLALFAGNPWQGIQLVDEISVKPKRTIAPAVRLTRRGSRVSLTGVVDSEATKARMGQAASGGGLEPDNRLEVDDKVRAFPDLDGLLAGIPGILKRAPKGRIDLSPEKVVLSDNIKALPDWDSLAASLKWPTIEWRKLKRPVLPSMFSFARKGNRVTLKGKVDSPTTRRRLEDSIKEKGLEVDNQIEVSDDVMAFPDLDPVLSGVPRLLENAPEGKIEVSPDKVVLSDEIKEVPDREKLLASFKWPKIQWGISRPTLPARFSFSRKGGKVTLRGKVDSLATRERLEKAVDTDGMEVDNQVEISEDVIAFPNLEPVLAGIPKLLSKAPEGTVDFTPEKVTLSDELKAVAAKEDLSSFKWPTMVWSDGSKVDTKKVEPTFAWMQRGPKKAILTGIIPDEAIRKKIVESARGRLGEDAELVDQMKVQDNVRKSPWVMALPEFVEETLPTVTEPNISIDNQESSIAGRVPDDRSINEVGLAFSGINPPGKLALNLQVAKAPTMPAKPERTVVPDVSITGTGDRLTVGGKVPNKSVHDTVVNSILGMNGIEKLKDDLTIADDVRETEYLEPLKGFIGQFYSGAVKEREFWLNEKQIKLKGVVPNEETKAKALALATPFKAHGIEVVDLITIEAPKMAAVTPADPAPANPAMARAEPGEVGQAAKPDSPAQPDEPGMKEASVAAASATGETSGADPAIAPINPDEGERFSVFFGTGEFHIRASQEERALQMLERAKSTTGKILIDGFADERGTDDLNVFLSDERAKRIRSFLTSNGIDNERIVSVTGRGAVTGEDYEKYRRSDVLILEK